MSTVVASASWDFFCVWDSSSLVLVPILVLPSCGRIPESQPISDGVVLSQKKKKTVMKTSERQSTPEQISIQVAILFLHFQRYFRWYEPVYSSTVVFDDPFQRVVDPFGASALCLLHVFSWDQWRPPWRPRVVSDRLGLDSLHFYLPRSRGRFLGRIAAIIENLNF